jgi:uncharacterized protein involved in exopolysaccharide biosynthesis
MSAMLEIRGVDLPAVGIDPPVRSEASTLADLLRGLFRHGRAIGGIVALALVAALALVLLLPPRFEAQTKILVRVGREQIAPLEISGTKFSNFVLNQRTETANDEVEILRRPQLMDLAFGPLKAQLESRNAALRAARQDGPVAAAWSEAAQWTSGVVALVRMGLSDAGIITRETADMRLRRQFLDALGVSIIKETNILLLSFTWSDPVFAADAVNTYAAVYRSEHVRLENDVAGMAELYNAQVSRTEAELTQATANLNSFLAVQGFTDPIAEKQLVVNRMQVLEQQISDATVEEQQFGRQIDAYKVQFEQTQDWLETPAVAQTMLPGLSDLDTKHADLMVQRDRLLTQFMPESRQIRDVETQIARLRKTKLLSLTNFLKSRQQVERQRISYAQEQLARSHERLDRLTLVQQRLTGLQDQREQLLNQLKTYRSQAEYLGLQQALNDKGLASVTVLGLAQPPERPSSPRKGLIMGLAAVLSVLFAVAYAMIAELMFKGFRDEREVRTYLGLPTVAALPLTRIR